MILQEKHPLLFDFFAGYFPDADLDGLTDNDVVLQFIANNNKDIIEKTKASLYTLDTTNHLLLEDIANEANRYFETNKETKNWIEMIKTSFEN